MSERMTFHHSPFYVWEMLWPVPASPLLKIIRLRKQWYLYPKHCSYPVLILQSQLKHGCTEGPSLDPDGRSLPTHDSIAVDFSTALLTTPMRDLPYYAIYPVTGTMPGTFQELTKCLTKLMKTGSQRSYQSKGPYTSRQEDSLMSARQRRLDSPGK